MDKILWIVTSYIAAYYTHKIMSKFLYIHINYNIASYLLYIQCICIAIPFPTGPSSKLLKNTSCGDVYSTSVAVIRTL